MHNPASKPFDPSIEVSPDNPCPFLRGLVGEGFVDGGTVPLGTLAQTIANASGEKGPKKTLARIQVRGVALIANGARHVLKSIWSGAQLDALRGGPWTSAAPARASLASTGASMRTRSRGLPASAGVIPIRPAALSLGSTRRKSASSCATTSSAPARPRAGTTRC